MFQWFRQMSVIARLRALALTALVAMLALSSTLLWTAYKQRVADRQAAASQRIDLAHASLQWSYARQQFGKLNATEARQHTLQVLDRMQRNHVAAGSHDDVASAMLGQGAATFGVVLLVSGLLWACIEITARDLRQGGRTTAEGVPRDDAGGGHAGHASDSRGATTAETGTTAVGMTAHRGQRRPPRGPSGYRQTAQAPSTAKAALHEDSTLAGDPSGGAGSAEQDAAAQEVKRLRMAGAI